MEVICARDVRPLVKYLMNQGMDLVCGVCWCMFASLLEGVFCRQTDTAGPIL